MAASTGAGPVLPFAFDGGGDQPVVTDNELIISALNVLFGTEVGEHPMEKDFGHELVGLLFYNFDNVAVQTQARILVTELISAFEDRIQVDAVNVFPAAEEPSSLEVRIEFTNITTGSSGATTVTIPSA